MTRPTACQTPDANQMPGSAAAQHTGGAIPFARAAAITPFTDFLHAIGAPTQRLLHQAGIPIAPGDDPEGLLPLLPIYQFLELAARREGLQDLGALIGQQSSAFDLGAFGAALKGTSTVGEYLRVAIQLIGAYSSGTQFWLRTEGSRIRINQYLKGPISRGRCIADVYTLTLTITMLRRFIGPHWRPDEVRLLRGDETLLGDLSLLGDAPLFVQQPHSSITLPRALLRLPVPAAGAANVACRGTSLSHCPAIPTGFADSYRQLILALLGGGYPSIQQAAASAGMSARTLQRRLAEVGISHSATVNAVRMQLAMDWLSNSERPIADIAAELGYADLSNFGRALRSRTGLSPSAFRQRTLSR